MTERKEQSAIDQPRRVWRWFDVCLFVISILAISVAANFFAERPDLRRQIDATKTRAYSLSRQTQTLLERLEGDWRISLVFVENDVDRATRTQIDEVLERYEEASDRIAVDRIDPTDPNDLDQYESLLQRLRALYADEVSTYELRLDEARDAYADALRFAEYESDSLAGVMQSLSTDDPVRLQLDRIRSGLSLLAQNGPQLLEIVDGSFDVTDAQPLPDYEKARDALVAGLTSLAQDLDTAADLFQTLDRGQPEPIRLFVTSAARRYDAFAIELQSKADPLVHLPPLDLVRIGQELARGEAAVITGPSGAAVIPAWQLLPKGNLRATGDGAISFDQRFRGEQLLSSTIRSLVVESMPMVVFVHVQPESMLRERDKRIDLFGVATILRANRYDVREWIVGRDERPQAAEGQRAVWIVVPPPMAERDPRSAFEPTREELALVGAAHALIADGENVLLSFYPSTMHKFEQPDPWRTLADAFDVDVDTSAVLFQRLVSEQGQQVSQPSFELVDVASMHPVGRAVQGQRLFLHMPLAVRSASPNETSVAHAVVLNAAPSAERWFEAEWIEALRGKAEAPEGGLKEPVSLAMAAERADPIRSAERQRAIIVGSAAWMYSSIADQVVNLGGNRVALLYPGNIELMLAAVAWLAEMEELIAQSPTSQQVARLEGITSDVRLRWQWIILAGLPIGALGLGLLVWLLRRF